jgi:type I restriction enzyme S subunit
MRDGWVQTPIGDVAQVLSGFAFKSELFNKTEGIPLIRIRDLPKRDSTEALYSGSYEDRYVVKKGDFLIGMDGEFHCYEWNGPDALLNQRVCRIQGFKLAIVIPRYIYFAVNQYLDKIEQDTGYTTVKHISAKQVLGITIPLPPLPEQKRIVDLIFSVDAYIEALQQQLESAKNSKSAYVNTIVSEIFARGKKTKIADIAEVKGGKRLPKGTPWSEAPTDHRYIRATDIKDGIILTENLVYVPDDVWPVISRYVVNQGDVVITIAGTIGQVGVIPAFLDGVNLTENAAKIVVDKKLVRSNYLSMLLGSSYYQQDIDSKTKKTTQPKLGLNMINSIEIPLPDLAEQDEIFSVVSQIDTLIASTNDLIMQTITLRTGLLSDLLSGEHQIPASYDRVIGAA